MLPTLFLLPPLLIGPRLQLVVQSLIPSREGPSFHLSAKEHQARFFFGSRPSPVQIPVGGCLANNLEGWIAIRVEVWVLAVLSEGYRIPFTTTPPVTSHPVGFRSYPSGSMKAVALDREVRLLFKKGR